MASPFTVFTLDPPHRFLLVCVNSPGGAPSRALPALRVREAINKAVLHLYGDMGKSLIVDVLHTEGRLVILRVENKSCLNSVWAALSVVDAVEQRPCVMHVAKVASTLMELAAAKSYLLDGEGG